MKFCSTKSVLAPGSFVLLAALSISCRQDSAEISQSKVYGGKKVGASQWSNVVALTETDTGVYCSGTLIHPSLVVTAGHCAEGFDAENVSVYVGQGAEGGEFQGQYSVDQIVPSPRYSRYSVGHDVGYVVLSKPVKLASSVIIPPLTDRAEKKELLAVGKAGQIVGFGNREDGGYGVKFEVSGKLTSLNKLEFNLGGNGVDSCQGDSGGPVFGKLLSGEWRLVGITSRGGACGTGGIYGIVSEQVCWIQKDSGIDLGLPEGTCD